MLTYSQETLRKIQMTELELLCEADRICRKCKIRYQIIAGTLLGAVRHGGFIPWDDDADIAMLRPEYDRFVRAVRTELDTDRFYFQDHHETPGYLWGYGKLRRKDSLFLREHQEHMPYEQGIFIDIFPLDAVPQSMAGRTFWNAECFLVRKALYARVGRTAENNMLKKAAYKALCRIPEDMILSYYDRMVERAAKIRSGYVRILLFPTPNRVYAYLRKWYEKSEEILFEGVSFRGIADTDGYLTFKFGNYRELPPPEQRKIHPVSALKIPGEKAL